MAGWVANTRLEQAEGWWMSEPKGRRDGAEEAKQKRTGQGGISTERNWRKGAALLLIKA
jgi:hypothetical protein